MFWESQAYFKNENFGFFKSLAQFLLSYPLNLLRVADQIASNRPDFYIANSSHTKQKIKKYYKKDSVVIYPPVEVLDLEKYYSKSKSSDYFIVISRLAPWKKIGIAVRACRSLELKLKIIGEGPDKKRLKKVSDENIEFLGFLKEEDKFELLANSKALINTQKEDFGIVPVEALALGKPVIAYKAGGVLDTIKEGETGVYFEEQTSESLMEVLKTFDHTNFEKSACRRQALTFDSGTFKKQVKDIINKVYLGLVG